MIKYLRSLIVIIQLRISNAKKNQKEKQYSHVFEIPE